MKVDMHANHELYSSSIIDTSVEPQQSNAHRQRATTQARQYETIAPTGTTEIIYSILSAAMNLMVVPSLSINWIDVCDVQ
jgi:hypothetical protein